MSDGRKHDDATTASNEFSEIWNRVSKHSQNRLRSNKSGKSPKQTPSVGTTSYTRCKGVETPKRRVKSSYTCLNNGDSPSDGDMLQDIIWDPTSPTPANNGKEPRQTRVFEISDIVNRIAPKDAKPVSVDSPLLQWIGDSAVPCTPEVREPRVRRKSTRQSKVEDLMKLARQFDINMHQQDKESAEQQNNTINNLSKHRNSTRPASCGDKTATRSCMEELKGPASRSQQVEEELHALFDGPTQRISGRLSQGSSTFSSSQDITGHTRISHPTAHSKGSEVCEGTSCLPTDSGKVEGQSNGMAVKGDDFDDDWEDDDLLNDSFVVEMTQNSALLKANTQTLSNNKKELVTKIPPISACKPTSVHSLCKGTSVHPQPSSGGLTVPCPKLKTTNRRTFKLESNPHFRGKMTPTKEHKSSSTVVDPQGKTQKPVQGFPNVSPVSSKVVTTLGSSKDTSDKMTKKVSIASSSLKDISDEDIKSLFDSETLWDDGDDDELLYQVCDNVERISNSQPQPEDPANCQELPFNVEENKRKATAPSTMERDWSKNSALNSNRRPTCSYVRSNSAPGKSSTPVNFQGWNIPAKFAGVNQSLMSQSHPGSRTSLGKFTQLRGTLDCGEVHVKGAVQSHTVSVRTPQYSNSHHASFKRHLSDSDAMSNKVFVTSQMTGKCSAAEIERKKQEAIARRRSRTQASLKPGAPS